MTHHDLTHARRYTRGSFEVLDQLVVPHGLEFLPVKDANDGWEMKRGAPCAMAAVSSPLYWRVESVLLALIS